MRHARPEEHGRQVADHAHRRTGAERGDRRQRVDHRPRREVLEVQRSRIGVGPHIGDRELPLADIAAPERHAALAHLLGFEVDVGLRPKAGRVRDMRGHAVEVVAGDRIARPADGRGDVGLVVELAERRADILGHMRRHEERRRPARRHVHRRRIDVAGEHRPDLAAGPRPDRRRGSIDAKRILHLDRARIIARSGVLHHHGIRARPFHAAVEAVGRERDLLEQQVGRSGRRGAARRVDARNADVEIVARLVVMEPERPLDARHIGQVAIIHHRLGQLDDLVQRHAVAREEQHRAARAFVGCRTGRRAGPRGRWRKAHDRTRIVGRQIVADRQRAPIGRVAGVLDTDREAAPPVDRALEAVMRARPLLERQVEVRRRHIIVGRQDRLFAVDIRRALAHLPHRHRADMAGQRRLLVIGVAVEIGERRQRRRIVQRPGPRPRHALETRHKGRPVERRIEIGIVAQCIAGRPHGRTARAVERAGVGVERITERHAAGRIPAVAAHADRVALGGLDPRARRRRIIGEFAGVAHHRSRLRRCEHRVIVRAGLRPALREDHAAARIEHDAGDLVRRRQVRDVELPARRAETAIVIEPHRPDLSRDRVEEPPALRGKAVDLPLGLRESPRAGVLRIEPRIGDVRGAAVVGDCLEVVLRPPVDAMVERVEDRAVFRQPVDQARIEVGHEELLRARIEHQCAETRPAIGRDRREQRGLAGLAVDLPDRAGIPVHTARAAPLARRKPRRRIARPHANRIAVRIVHHQVKAERRGGRHIDIGRIRAGRERRIVERHTEHQPHIRRARAERRGRVDQLALGRRVRVELLDDERASVEVDETVVERVAAVGHLTGLHHPGKSRDDRLARL